MRLIQYYYTTLGDNSESAATDKYLYSRTWHQHMKPGHTLVNENSDLGYTSPQALREILGSGVTRAAVIKVLLP